MSHSHPTRPIGWQAHRRMSLWVLSLIVLVSLFFGPSGGWVAHAAPLQQVLPYKTTDGSAEIPPLKLFEINGNSPFVQHDPKVYLIFWGPKWQTDTATINTIVNTFQALAGSDYNNILSQYGDGSGPNGYVHNNVQVMDATSPLIDTSTPPSNIDIGFETQLGVWDNAQIRHEADTEIAQQQWVVNQDSQVIVFPQQGSTYNHGDDFCGVHSYDSTASSPYAYALIQYGDQNSGCDFVGDAAEDISWTAVHEYAEMATDPVIRVNLVLTGPPWYDALGAGWHTDDGSKSTPQEVADLCAGYDVSSGWAYHDYQSVRTGAYFTLPLLWSNAANGCVSSSGQEYSSPDFTLSFNGKHTVQGAILGKYQSAYNESPYTTVIGLVGAPLSEETPITSLSVGRVTYFAGQVCNGGYVIPTSAQNGNGGGGLTSGSAIYYGGSAGTHEVHGCIYHEYTAVMGGPNGLLSFPITDETSIAGARVSYFFGQVCNGGGPNGSGSAIYSGAGIHEVHGCIYHEYISLGGPGGSLGFPVSDEQAAVNGGRVSYFAGHGCSTGGPDGSGSAIYYNAGNTYYVWGCIYARYQATCQQVSGPCVNLLGLPVTSEESIAGGAVSYFAGQVCNGGYAVKDENGISQISGSAIYSGSGVHEVHGCIYQKYTSLGGPNSYLGFPTSDETAVTGGRVSYFQGTSCGSQSYGAIYIQSGATTAHEVDGCTEQKYKNLGGPGSVLGFPTSDEMLIAGWHVSYFQGTSCGGVYYGRIYSSSAGTHEIHGCIDQKYESIGGPNSHLGFPVSDQYTNSAGHPESDFQGGYIVWENGAAVVVLYV